MAVPRPWRATAFLVPRFEEVEGRRRPVAGRASAKTRDGLDRFVRAHEAEGHVVDVVEVLELLDEIPGNA